MREFVCAFAALPGEAIKVPGQCPRPRHGRYREVTVAFSAIIGFVAYLVMVGEACWLAPPGPQGSSVTLAAGDLEEYLLYGDFLRL